MKTIKINENVHKELLKIKAYYGYKTISDTISECVDNFNYNNTRIEKPKRIRDIRIQQESIKKAIENQEKIEKIWRIKENDKSKK